MAKSCFILFGNSDPWNRKGSRLENACEEHLKYCQRQQLDTAKAVEGIDVRHLIDPDLQNLPFYDGEHFHTGAAPHLLKLLHELLDEDPLKKTEPKQNKEMHPFLGMSIGLPSTNVRITSTQKQVRQDGR